MSTRSLVNNYENNYGDCIFPAQEVTVATGPFMPTGAALQGRVRTIGLQLTTSIMVDGKPIKVAALLTHEDAIWLRDELRRVIRDEPEYQ